MTSKNTSSALCKRILRNPRPKRVPKKVGWTPPHVLAVVKKTPSEEELKAWLSTVSGFVSALTQDMEGYKSSFYDYQLEHMENMSSFRHIDKARQVGFSYAFAAEALAKCHIQHLQTSIFISYNQEEANEKIRFARALYETIPAKFQKKLIVDNKQSLEFDYNGKRTRILSFAQRQPRGKGNNTDVYLDELAHMIWARPIYVAALPVITRGTGVLTAASTPLGKNNLHYEISTDEEKYYMFSRMRVSWWDCSELCTNVPLARINAPRMETEERVEQFATMKLKAFLSAMDIDDFRQEYELYYADEIQSYYPLDLIKSCTYDYEKSNFASNINPSETAKGWDPVGENEEKFVEETIMDRYSDKKIFWHQDGLFLYRGPYSPVSKVNYLIDKVVSSMNKNQYGRTLIAGVDIGRKKNSSEISVFEQIDFGGYNLHVERISVELVDIAFKEQRAILRSFLERLPIKKMRIDGTGMGIDIAEGLEEEYGRQRVECVIFNIDNKAEMAKNFRYRLEDRTIALYNDHDSIQQIHSIKKTITDASNVKYGTSKTVKKHHGDKFWAKALASSGGDNYDRNKVVRSVLGNMASHERIFTPHHTKGGIIVPLQQHLSIPIISRPKIGVRFDGNKISFANPMWNIFADTSLKEV